MSERSGATVVAVAVAVHGRVVTVAQPCSDGGAAVGANPRSASTRPAEQSRSVRIRHSVTRPLRCVCCCSRVESYH